MTLEIKVKRRCKKCEEEKSLVEFTKNKNCKYGREYTCRECASTRKLKWSHANPDQHKDNQLTWRKNNKKRYRASQAKWNARNKEYTAARVKRYRKANPGWMAAQCAKRRASKLKATPSWANLSSIETFYRDAHAQGKVVDHIIPLQNKIVCGLHVETNLQLLTSSENSRKGNKFDPASIDNLLRSINPVNCWKLPQGQSAAKPLIGEGSTTNAPLHVHSSEWKRGAPSLGDDIV